jgi:hypothetical protein
MEHAPLPGTCDTTKIVIIQTESDTLITVSEDADSRGAFPTRW